MLRCQWIDNKTKKETAILQTYAHLSVLVKNARSPITQSDLTRILAAEYDHKTKILAAHPQNLTVVIDQAHTTSKSKC